jgi:hypothetical protein
LRLRLLWGRGISWSCLCRRFREGLDSIGEVMLDVLGAASGEEDEKVRCKRIGIKILTASHRLQGMFAFLPKTL